MSWYQLQGSGLIVRDKAPEKGWSGLMLALANTLDQASKLEEDPDEAAAAVGAELYNQGITLEPAGNLRELLDQAMQDEHLESWLMGLGSLPTVKVDDPNPEPDLWTVASGLWSIADLEMEDDSPDRSPC